jgi:uncharacterized membrane protein
MSEKTMIIIGQVFIVVLALILAFMPKLYMIAIIAYFALIFGVSMVRARRSTGGVSRDEIMRARSLFKEDKAFEVALEDEEYVKAMSRQAKAMMIPLLLFPIYILIFRYVPHIQGNIAHIVGDEKLATFLVWFAAFEAMFLLNQAIRRITASGGSMAPLVPAGYRVTDKGIVFKGGMGQVIGFPFPEGTKVRLDSERNYVELQLPGSGAPIRLYTRKARRLYELIMRYGFKTSAGSGREGKDEKDSG